MKSKTSTKILALVMVVLFGVGLYASYHYFISPKEDETAEVEKISDRIAVRFAKQVDGDTAGFLMNGQDIVVRFQAIDASDDVPADIAEKAAAFTKESLQKAKKVEIEFQLNEDGTYKEDFAWVWVDDALLEELLVSQGYARIANILGNYPYLPQLEKAQEQAKQAKVGLWASET